MKKILIFTFGISILFGSCKSVHTLKETATQYYKVDKKIDNAKSTEVEKIIAPYKQNLDAKMNEVIGYTDGLSKKRTESTLGNWVADVIESKSANLTDKKIDFAIQNHGGLRLNSVAKGSITLGKVYEIMPFENFIVILEANGQSTLKFLNRMAEYGGWPISKSVKYIIKDNKATSIFIKGEPFNINRTYIIALPDYIANGGDKCFFLKDQPRETTGVLIRDILIEDIKDANENGKSIKAKIEGRVIISD